MILTALWCPDCDHLVGLMQLAETLSEHLHMVGGVWFQHRQFVAGLVAVSVHNGPLLGAHKSEDRNRQSGSRLGAERCVYLHRIIVLAVWDSKC